MYYLKPNCGDLVHWALWKLALLPILLESVVCQTCCWWYMFPNWMYPALKSLIYSCLQSATSFLQYLDVSVGKEVAAICTKTGRLDVMCQNPHNAIIHLGHHNGTVTLWSPNQKEALVKMLCHQGAVRSVAVDKTGTWVTHKLHLLQVGQGSRCCFFALILFFETLYLQAGTNLICTSTETQCLLWAVICTPSSVHHGATCCSVLLFLQLHGDIRHG